MALFGGCMSDVVIISRSVEEMTTSAYKGLKDPYGVVALTEEPDTWPVALTVAPDTWLLAFTLVAETSPFAVIFPSALILPLTTKSPCTLTFPFSISRS